MLGVWLLLWVLSVALRGPSLIILMVSAVDVKQHWKLELEAACGWSDVSAPTLEDIKSHIIITIIMITIVAGCLDPPIRWAVPVSEGGPDSNDFPLAVLVIVHKV